MLCGTKVMCSNHAKCNPEGRCDWTGDYGSYQEHIRACQNVPLRCGLSSTEAEDKDRMAAYSQRGVEIVASETTLEPISVDASESSDCSVCEETFAATSNDNSKEIPEIASSNEPAPVETSSL